MIFSLGISRPCSNRPPLSTDTPGEKYDVNSIIRAHITRTKSLLKKEHIWCTWEVGADIKS
jgi:hypothetical protein